MTRATAFAVSLSALAAFAAPALAQDDTESRAATGRAATAPLSTRALPAAPPVHKLSIGPLSTPAEDATIVPHADAPYPSAGVDASAEALVQRANRGDADANYRLGLRHLAGEGVARDFVEAFARIRLAAEAGHPRAISLFYAMGARLTAEEHGKAYLRTQQLRSSSSAAR